MELKYIRGCVHDNILVDGVQEMNISDEERKIVLEKIAKSLKPSDLNILLQEIIPIFGELESSDGPCESCGDYVDTYVLQV